MAVIVMTLGACGESGGSQPSTDEQTGGSAGGDNGNIGGSAGSAHAGDDDGGSQSQTPEGGAGNASVGGAQGQAGEGTMPSSVLCKGAAPFGTPQLLAGVTPTDHQAGPRLTPDELTLAYLCADGDYTNTCIAQRASLSAPFELSDIAVMYYGGVPWISDDTLTLFYEDDQGRALYMTQRGATDEAFPKVTEPLALDGFFDPYVVGGSNGRLYLSDDYPGDIYVISLDDWAVPAANATPTLVPGASTDARDVRPVLTSDELTLYYASDVGTTLEIWRKQRASRNEPFGEGAAVSELNITGTQFPGWISPDGCRIYFDSGDTERDLYVAERAP